MTFFTRDLEIFGFTEEGFDEGIPRVCGTNGINVVNLHAFSDELFFTNGAGVMFRLSTRAFILFNSRTSICKYIPLRRPSSE